MFQFSKRSRKNLEGIHPDLVKVMTESIKTSPVDFTITDGVRTTGQQQALYAKGRTKPGFIVTNADGVRNKSNHQAKADGYGYAIDLYPFYGGIVHLNDYTRLRAVAEHIKKIARQLNIKIEWGGDWKKFRDYPHFELKK